MAEFVTCSSTSIGPLLKALGLGGSTTSATIYLEAGELVRMTTERPYWLPVLQKYGLVELDKAMPKYVPC